MRARFTAYLFVLMALLASAAGAQPPPAPGAQPDTRAIMELRLNDGSVLYGYIEHEETDRLVFRTIGGAAVDVARRDIESLRPAHGRVVGGQFRPFDSNTTRMFFAPTGRSLGKGEGYIGVYEFLLPFVQVGVTDRFSMGAGTPLVFVGDESAPPVWLTPKYQVHKGERTSAAAGVLHFVGIGSSSQVGIAYGVATTGTEDNAFTIGAGWAYARYRTTGDRPPCELPLGSRGCGEPAKTTKHVGSAVLMAGGERRVSRRIKVVSENYVFREGGIVSLGVRFLGERLSADLGGFAPIGAGEFVLAPVVNFAWKFGR